MKGWLSVSGLILLGFMSCVNVYGQPALLVLSDSEVSGGTTHSTSTFHTVYLLQSQTDPGIILAQYDVRSRQYQLQKACYDECYRRYQRLLARDRKSGGVNAARWYDRCLAGCR